MDTDIGMEDQVDPVFRTSKRRKVFRRRLEDGEEEKDTTTLLSAASNGDAIEDQKAPQGVQKPMVKRQGIAFTSQSRAQATKAESNEETAIMAIHPSREANVIPGSNRFMKPTGKTEVADDKHMMAFVDSKLAEMRSTASATTLDSDDGNVDEPEPGDDHQESSTSQAPTSIVAQQRQRNERRRRPRQPCPRDPNDLARASLIDDIMKESSLTHYDRPVAETGSQSKADNEDAAAEAFKAQYVRDLAERNRRRPAAPPAFNKLSQAKASDRAAHGPKLGGSRAQRERMKAAQAEAGKEGVKK